MDKRKQRRTNIELLRIVSMLMIITLHFIGHGGVNDSYTTPGIMCVAVSILKGICMVAVNCFVLISGYFGVKSSFSWKKVLKLEAQIWTYSVVIFSILAITGAVKFGLKDIVCAVFPVSTNMDGFSTGYLIMYILSPYLNKIVNACSKKELKRLLILLASFFVVLPEMFAFLGTTIEFGGPYGVVWFWVLYLTGAYIRLYSYEKISLKRRAVIYCFWGVSCSSKLYLCHCIIPNNRVR